MSILKSLIYFICSFILFFVFTAINRYNKKFKGTKKVKTTVINSYPLPNGEDDYKPVFYNEYEFKYNKETRKCVEYSNQKLEIGSTYNKLVLKENDSFKVYDISAKKENQWLILIFSILLFILSIVSFSNTINITVFLGVDKIINVIIGIIFVLFSFKELFQYNKLKNKIKYELLSLDGQVYDFEAHCDNEDNHFMYAPIYMCKINNKSFLIPSNDFKENITFVKGDTQTIYITPEKTFVFSEDKIKKHKESGFTCLISGLIIVVISIL